MNMALKIGVPNSISAFAGGGGAPPVGVTASMEIIGPDYIIPNTTGVVVRITLSEIRGVNTVFTVVSENPDTNYYPSGVLEIASGELSGDFEVTSGGSELQGPFEVSATSDIPVLNSVTLIMM